MSKFISIVGFKDEAQIYDTQKLKENNNNMRRDQYGRKLNNNVNCATSS